MNDQVISYKSGTLSTIFFRLKTSSPTTSPTSVPSTSPSIRPSASPSSSPSISCFPKASRVKLQSLTGALIHVFEVQVYSSGNNVASGKVASQSSTFKNKTEFGAQKAVDGNRVTFSHTAVDDYVPWWEVDLGEMYIIDSVKILNRWCGKLDDPSNCLGRLSHAAILLFTNQRQWVSTTFLGQMRGVSEFEHKFTKTTEFCN